MLAAVVSGFVLAALAPYLHRLTRGASGWLLALLPLALAVYFATHIADISDGEVLAQSHRWVSSLDVSLSFYLDGLSLLFALLITVIGALVLVYSGGYLAGHPHLGRFYAAILMFMASMLGLVLADNVITLFVFWELTSFSSYLLIGFDSERDEARKAALQALLVTAIGGLALLAGLVLLGQAGGSFELSTLTERGDLVREDGLYLSILLLVAVGAFTKSAQVPFHFWLPGAMEAPTPVSAYLHSATMVKAGVYLIARLHPALGGTDEWLFLMTAAGLATMLVGAYMALQATDLKRILAYSTVSVLGTLIMLLGQEESIAIKAAIVFLLAHALYKGALFLVAGAVDHETGERDARRLGGLYLSMPITAIVAGLAAASMAALPPLLGFIGKEGLYEAALDGDLRALVSVGSVAASMLLVAVAIVVGLRPFVGDLLETPKKPREAPVSLWLGPAVLGGAGLLFGVLPFLVADSITAPAVTAILREPVEVDLALWHGLTVELGLSALTVAGGLALYVSRQAIGQATAQMEIVHRWGPGRWYELGLAGLNLLAYWQTRILQSGYLRYYLLIIVFTAVGLTGFTLVDRGGLKGPENWEDIRFYEVGVAALILLGALVAVFTRSRLAAIAALGIVGYGIALIYLLFNAPDLAMAQVLIETLTVVLFVLVFYHLPGFAVFSAISVRLRDAFVALTAGGLMTALLLTVTGRRFSPPVSDYFVENSLPLAKGKNIVNVILVDFRALDTLGEITVLVLAGAGVFALLKLRLAKKGDE